MFKFADEDADPAGEESMGKEDRDGDDEPGHGGDQCFGDALGKDAFVAGAKKGDQLKGGDHAGDGSQKTEKRGDASENGEGAEVAVEAWEEPQHAFVEDFLELFGVGAGVGEEAVEEFAKRGGGLGGHGGGTGGIPRAESGRERVDAGVVSSAERQKGEGFEEGQEEGGECGEAKGNHGESAGAEELHQGSAGNGAFEGPALREVDGDFGVAFFEKCLEGIGVASGEKPGEFGFAVVELSGEGGVVGAEPGQRPKKDGLAIPYASIGGEDGGGDAGRGGESRRKPVQKMEKETGGAGVACFKGFVERAKIGGEDARKEGVKGAARLAGKGGTFRLALARGGKDFALGEEGFGVLPPHTAGTLDLLAKFPKVLLLGTEPGGHLAAACRNFRTLLGERLGLGPQVRMCGGYGVVKGKSLCLECAGKEAIQKQEEQLEFHRGASTGRRTSTGGASRLTMARAEARVAGSTG